MSEATINEAKKVKLLDGSDIELRPLKLSLLRPFMEKFAELEKVAENNNKSMDVLVACVQIAMKQYKPEIAEDKKALEDNIDLPTVYAIIEVAGGINLNGVSLG
jgi:hypothetical protein